MSSQNNEMFKGLLSQSFRNLIDSTNNNNNSALARLFLALLAIIFFSGDEAAKLLLRHRFGKSSIGWGQIFISIIIFGIIAFFSFDIYFTHSTYGENIEIWGSRDSFLLTGIFYSLFSIWLTIKAFIVSRKVKKYKHSSLGDSQLLFFMISDRWPQWKVQAILEPLLLIAVGIFFCGVNFLWGIPIIVLGLSMWGMMFLQAVRIKNPVGSKLRQVQNRKQDDFSEPVK